MIPNWKLTAAALLILGSALSGCYGDRPGGYGPPRHGHHDHDGDGGYHGDDHHNDH